MGDGHTGENIAVVLPSVGVVSRQERELVLSQHQRMEEPTVREMVKR